MESTKFEHNDGQHWRSPASEALLHDMSDRSINILAWYDYEENGGSVHYLPRSGGE